MKSKEELTALKEEVETVSKKTCPLTDDELNKVSGGVTETCVRKVEREDVQDPR